MLKKGNYIKIKQNTKIESGEIINNWAGRIEKIYKKEKCCLVSLDAQTINSLSDSFLQGAIEKDAEPFKYIFNLDDIVLSKRRDSDKEVMIALEKLSSRVIDLEKEIEKEQYKIKVM